MKLTAAEKKLVELYRKADADTREEALAVLKGEGSSGGEGSLLGAILETAIGVLSQKDRSLESPEDGE